MLSHRRQFLWLLFALLCTKSLLKRGLRFFPFRAEPFSRREAKQFWQNWLHWQWIYSPELPAILILTLAILNELRCHPHFWVLANQIAWAGLLLLIQILDGKQCRSRSVGFFRSQLIWIYTVCKGRIYPVSVGQGLKFRWGHFTTRWYVITLCMLSNFACFFCHLWIFFN